MKCDCGEYTVIDNRCKHHFVADFETKVRKTIEDNNLIKSGEKIAVACSGGKDSLTVLTILKKLYGEVTAVAIDEGIADYREHTLVDLKKVCDEQKIPLIIKSFKDFSGHTLDQALKKKDFHPCGLCGAFRKHLLLLATKDFDVVATGHNMDDEAQSVLMNLCKGNTEVLWRTGPVSGAGAKGFVKRVKPLYFCTEKEVMTYAYLNGLTTKFTECPNIHGAYRDILRNALNDYEKDHRGAKRQIVDKFLKMKGKKNFEKTDINSCNNCGEPCSQDICKACQYLEALQ
ncbi:TIGR00269 family protein [Candidatus Woesearchaeota archaeon]|nr:TIGR00269 family protein [Candidatus Woesearchaeota archaeon]